MHIVEFPQEEHESLLAYIDRYAEWLGSLKGNYFTTVELAVTVIRNMNTPTRAHFDSICGDLSAKSGDEALELIDWLASERSKPDFSFSSNPYEVIETCEDFGKHEILMNSWEAEVDALEAALNGGGELREVNENDADLEETETFAESPIRDSILEEEIVTECDRGEATPIGSSILTSIPYRSNDLVPSFPLLHPPSCLNAIPCPYSSDYFEESDERPSSVGANVFGTYKFRPSDPCEMINDHLEHLGSSFVAYTITWIDLFSSHNNSSSVHDKFYRFLTTITLGSTLTYPYMHFDEWSSQAYDRLLRALNASALNLFPL